MTQPEPEKPRLLTDEEQETLRQEMKKDGDSMRRELQRRAKQRALKD